jgi:hypothetical protein
VESQPGGLVSSINYSTEPQRSARLFMLAKKTFCIITFSKERLILKSQLLIKKGNERYSETKQSNNETNKRFLSRQTVPLKHVLGV